MKVLYDHCSLPAAGETENGDRAYVRSEGDSHLLAVVDGLGHGPDAAAVSAAAVRFFETVDLSLPLLTMMESVHRTLLGSRGAAATICVLNGPVLAACAVGNVEVRSGELKLPLVASPGVLGVRVAKFRICQTEVKRTGRFILFSDGISTRTRFEEYAHLPPAAVCRDVMQAHRRDYDDSTVLVADLEP